MKLKLKAASRLQTCVIHVHNIHSTALKDASPNNNKPLFETDSVKFTAETTGLVIKLWALETVTRLQITVFLFIKCVILQHFV